MKKKLILLVIVFTAAFSFQSNAQFDTGLDIYSSYIWRGAKFGSGPAFQPWVEYGAGDFAIGAWGSVSAGSSEALEMDLYASYSIGPVSLTVTDYYFGGDWMNFSPDETIGEGPIHFIEPMASVALGDFSFTGAYMFYNGAGNGDASGDLYLEAGYSFGSFDLTVGGGNGQYSTEDVDEDDAFAICNIGIGTSKEIAISETFSLPVSGAVILNPSSGGFFITVGISL